MKKIAESWAWSAGHEEVAGGVVPGRKEGMGQLPPPCSANDEPELWEPQDRTDAVSPSLGTSPGNQRGWVRK